MSFSHEIILSVRAERHEAHVVGYQLTRAPSTERPDLRMFVFSDFFT